MIKSKWSFFNVLWFDLILIIFTNLLHFQQLVLVAMEFLAHNIRPILLLLKLPISALTTSTSTSKVYHFTQLHCFRIDLYHDKRFIHYSSTRSYFRLIDESMFDFVVVWSIDWTATARKKEILIIQKSEKMHLPIPKSDMRYFFSNSQTCRCQRSRQSNWYLYLLPNQTDLPVNICNDFLDHHSSDWSRRLCRRLRSWL